MYGATFKELTTVTDVEVLQDKSIMFTLSHLFNGYELCSVTGYIESSVKLVSVERNNTNDPQESFDVDIEVPCIKGEAAAFIDSAENVLFVKDMPFRLTELQLSKINECLEGEAV